MTAFGPQLPLCQSTCDQRPVFHVRFTDPVSGRKLDRYACANHLTEWVWAAVMQAGSWPVTVKAVEF